MNPLAVGDSPRQCTCRRGEGLEQTGPDERIINIQFGWGGDVKPVSTLFVGTSPEFDMALYTLCFCAGEQENFVHLGPYEVKIRCDPPGPGMLQS